MKRKFLVVLLAIACVVCCAVAIFMLGGCNNSGGTISPNPNGSISGGDESCEHQWGSWSTVSEATCTEKGKQERFCSVCGGKETKEIPALGHSFNTNNTCTRCGYELTPTVGLEYKEFTRNDETYEMVTGIGTATDTDLVIPAYHAGKAVRKINDNAFNGKDALKTLYIANGVQEIGEKAFAYCTSLTKIELPESLSENVYELVRVPDVYYVAYRRVYIPNLGVQAFYGCTKLSEIIMPKKGLRIASNVFDSTAYYNNANNWNNNVLFVQNHLIAANSNFDSEIYNLNANVVSIADKAFDGKSCLKEFNVPLSNSLQRMADNALSNSSIINAEMPYDFLSYLPAQNIKKLKVNCSETIYNLQQFVNVEELNVNGDWVDTSYWSGDEVPPLQGMGKLKKLTIKWIGGKGHRRQYTLGELFGETEYSGSVAIKQRTGTDSWNQPIYDTLYVPSNLNEVTVLSGGITSYAFHEMSSISKINLGSDVNSVGDNICYHCNEQVVVNFANETEFLSTTKTASSYVISDSLRNHKYTKLTIDNKDIVDFKIPDGTTNIKECAFINCAELKSVTIPSSVTSIDMGAFAYCESLTSITIPDSVTSIGWSAFAYCESLASIKIPDRVTSIGKSAFYGCTSLESINVPDGVTSIDDRAFNHCTSLAIITIPDGVTSIGSSAFNGCTSLESINVPDGVTSIGSSAFNGCTSLGSVNFGDNSSLTSIGGGAFYGCTSLNSVTIPDSVTSIGSSAFSGCTKLIQKQGEVQYVDKWIIDCNTSVTTVDLRTDTRGIADYAFSGCKSLNSVTIPDSVTSIGDSVFDNCTSLESITIPDGVTFIGGSAFYGCTSLVKVYITDLKAWCNIDFCDYDANPLFYAENLYLNDEPLTEITADMLQGVTAIPGYAFSCTSLESITIPDSVTSIDDRAFYNCTSLNSVTIPDSVTSIGWGAFEGCSSLESVNFGNSSKLTSIGEEAFYGCTSLESITIPDSVTSIGEEAFSGCSSLESITLPFVGSSKYATTASSSTLFGYIFGGWHSYTGGTAITQFYAPSLYDRNSVTYYIPDKLKSVTITGGNILYGAFSNCSNLTSITIGDSVPSIGGYAFNKCTSLTSITIGNGVTSIGYNAFRGCTRLKSIEIPDSVTSIVDYAFYECTSLTSVTFNNTVGWKVSKNSDMSNASDVTLGTPEQNANYLKNTYYSYYWKRES